MDESTDNRIQMFELSHATARVLIASYFLAKAFGVILVPNGMEAFLSLSYVPEYLFWPNTAFLTVASLAILTGFQTRVAAALLALYMFWSSFILNYVPNNPIALGAFWGDLTIVGGLLMLFSYGRGRFALDNLLADQPAEEPVSILDQRIENIAIKPAE